MDSQAIVEHVQANIVAYAVILVCGLPALYLGRKYTVPFILYTIEIIIYIGLVHVALHVLTRVTAWFRDSSSFDRAFGQDSDPTNWTTPLLEPWDRAAYEPEWLYWVPIVSAVLIVIAVFRFRPMKVHKGRERKYSDTGKRVGPGSRGGRSGRPH